MMPEELPKNPRGKERERTYHIKEFIQLSFNQLFPSNNEASSPDRSMYDAAVFTVLSFNFERDRGDGRHLFHVLLEVEVCFDVVGVSVESSCNQLYIPEI
jgi:hypothetical protein